MAAIWAEADRLEAARQRQTRTMSPRERMIRFERLQRQAWETLQANPEGMDRFIRRNRSIRRDANRRRLEAELLHLDSGPQTDS